MRTSDAPAAPGQMDEGPLTALDQFGLLAPRCLALQRFDQYRNAARTAQAQPRAHTFDGSDGFDASTVAVLQEREHLPVRFPLHRNDFQQDLAGCNGESHGRILAELAAAAGAGRLRPTVTMGRHGLTVDSIREAHKIAESGRSIGKTVITA